MIKRLNQFCLGFSPLLAPNMTHIARVSFRKHEPLRTSAHHVTVEPTLIAQMLAGAVLGAVRWWLSTDMQQTPEAMAYTFSQIAAPGVLASMGLDAL